MEFILGGCLLLAIITNLVQLVYNNSLISKNNELKSNVSKLESKKSGIIQFMNNKWVSRKDISIIIDTATIRNNKLKQLGID